MEVTLAAQTRTATGKGPARQARLSGKVPSVLYGAGLEPTSLLVDAKQMANALHTEAGSNVLINLEFDGKKILTIPREVQKHPVRGNLVHVDFVHVERNVKISAQVALHIVGESRGVKEGGQLDQHLHEVSLEALPTDLPPGIEVDITDLGIGDSLRISDLQVPSGVEILTDAEELIIAVIEAHELQVEAEGEDAEAAAAEGDEAAAEPASTETAPPQ